MTDTEILRQAREADEGFPLTDIQAAYMVGRSRLIELGGRQQYYLELDAVDFDPHRAEEAVNMLVARHEHLRTVMGEDGLQRVTPADRVARVPVTVHDLTGLDPAARDEALRRTRERMCDDGLDPAGWPLFQIAASRVRSHRYRVHLRASLLLLDAPGIRTVVGEWWELYQRPCADLPPITTTFREWRAAMSQHESGERFDEQWRYWEERLDDLPEAPQLPLARQPQSIEAVRFHGRTSYLTGEQWQQFCENFRKHRVLPTTALLHVYAEALGAWAASPHFCLNVVHLNHATRHGNGEQVVGQRTATLPLEIDLAAGGFWNRAQRLQRQLWRDMAKSDVTAVRISRELAARRGWTQRATLPYVFTSNQGPGWESMAAYSRPRFRFLERIQHTPQVLVDDQIRDMPDGGIGSNLDFVDEAFPDGLPDLVVEAYHGMLQALAAPDGADIEPELVPARHRALIAAVNDTAAPVPDGRLEDGFLRQARAHGDAPAVVTSERTLDYRELEARSRVVARWLIEQGVRREDVVPVLMSKGWEQIVAVLGVLRAGAAYCPIDAAVPALPVRDMLDECGTRVMLTQSHSFPAHAAGLPHACLDVDLAAADGGAELPHVEAGPDDLAYVIYTSGSTGKAKGVLLEHRAALNTVLDINQRLGLGPADRVFGISSMSFDLSVWDVFGALAAGATLVVPDATSRPDPVAWAQAAARHGVTVWNSVPALTEMLVEIAEQRPDMPRPGIRAFMLSGDWIPTALPGRLRALWPDMRVMAMGGATEAAIWSNLYEVGDVDPRWSSIPYGRPLTNQTMRVLDHRLDIRQPWATGRIYIGGTGLARGYRGDPERTAERFIRHPETGERLYWTGDLGRYWPDGTIEFMGREDRQVKILGFRVEPGAVETAARSHPDVRECVVCVDDAPGGQRRMLLLATAEPGAQTDPRELAAHLRTMLPHYMVPAQIRMVDQLPLTGNGKVDVARARALLAEAETQSADGADDSPIAKQLQDIWADLLQLPSVDPNGNFFALGGNSLLALRMVNRVRAEFGVELPLGQVFEAPTVRAFAACVVAGAGDVGCRVELTGGGGDGAEDGRRDGEEIFLFQVLGGSVAPYLAFARGWPGPVHGFQARGLARADAELPPDLETMAAEYREQIQRHRPQGPYAVGGWSMGGFLAWEVARQLSAQGHKAYVLMIDADIPDLHLPDTEVGRHLAFMVNLTMGLAPQAAVDMVRAAQPGEVVRTAHAAAVTHGLLPAEVDAAGYERLMRIHENDLRVVEKWQPGPMDEEAVLFLAEEERERRDPGAFWRGLGPRVAVQTAPGDHFSIGEGDRLADIARRGARWLEERRRSL